MSTPSDDAQRDMEQRALRNVRNLVDKYEDKEVNDSRSVRRLATGIVAAVVALAVVVFVLSQITVNEPGHTIVLPPPVTPR